MKVAEIIRKIDSENGWFGRMSDFVEDCEENGLIVEEINAEYACIYDDNGNNECVVYFGGTERTITIDHIEEV